MQPTRYSDLSEAEFAELFYKQPHTPTAAKRATVTGDAFTEDDEEIDNDDHHDHDDDQRATINSFFKGLPASVDHSDQQVGLVGWYAHTCSTLTQTHTC